jgi:hypothetical protein
MDSRQSLSKGCAIIIGLTPDLRSSVLNRLGNHFKAHVRPTYLVTEGLRIITYLFESCHRLGYSAV